MSVKVISLYNFLYTLTANLNNCMLVISCHNYEFTCKSLIIYKNWIYMHIYVPQLSVMSSCVPDQRSAQCGLVSRVCCCVFSCVPDRRSAQCGLVGRV